MAFLQRKVYPSKGERVKQQYEVAGLLNLDPCTLRRVLGMSGFSEDQEYFTDNENKIMERKMVESDFKKQTPLCISDEEMSIDQAAEVIGCARTTFQQMHAQYCTRIRRGVYDGKSVREYAQTLDQSKRRRRKSTPIGHKIKRIEVEQVEQGIKLSMYLEGFTPECVAKALNAWSANV